MALTAASGRKGEQITIKTQVPRFERGLTKTGVTTKVEVTTAGVDAVQLQSDAGKGGLIPDVRMKGDGFAMMCGNARMVQREGYAAQSKRISLKDERRYWSDQWTQSNFKQSRSRAEGMCKALHNIERGIHYQYAEGILDSGCQSVVLKETFEKYMSGTVKSQMNIVGADAEAGAMPCRKQGQTHIHFLSDFSAIMGSTVSLTGNTLAHDKCHHNLISIHHIYKNMKCRLLLDNTGASYVQFLMNGKLHYIPARFDHATEQFRVRMIVSASQHTAAKVGKIFQQQMCNDKDMLASEQSCFSYMPMPDSMFRYGSSGYPEEFSEVSIQTARLFGTPLPKEVDMCQNSFPTFDQKEARALMVENNININTNTTGCGDMCAAFECGQIHTSTDDKDAVFQFMATPTTHGRALMKVDATDKRADITGLDDQCNTCMAMPMVLRSRTKVGTATDDTAQTAPIQPIDDIVPLEGSQSVIPKGAGQVEEQADELLEPIVEEDTEEDDVDAVEEMEETFKHCEKWTREGAEDRPHNLYLFGENDVHRGTDHRQKTTQAVVRGLTNACGLRTCSAPGKGYSDLNVEDNVVKFSQDLNKAFKMFKNGSFTSIVIPILPFGAGQDSVSNLQQGAPTTFYDFEQLFQTFKRRVGKYTASKRTRNRKAASTNSEPSSTFQPQPEVMRSTRVEELDDVDLTTAQDCNIRGAKAGMHPREKQRTEKEMHERHGHVGYMPGCHVCAILRGKLRSIYSKVDPFHSVLPGQRWHGDVITWSERNKHGEKYTYGMVDECSGTIVVANFKKRSDLTEVVGSCIDALRSDPDFSHLGFPCVQQLRLDRDGAWREDNKEFVKAMKEHNVRMEYADGQDKRSHAFAENLMKQIELTAKSMLVQTSMQPEWWGEAVHLAALIRNCYPRASAIVSSDGDTERPLEILSKGRRSRRQLDNILHHAVAFGQLALVTNGAIKGSNITTSKARFGICIGMNGDMPKWMCPFRKVQFQSKQYMEIPLPLGISAHAMLGIDEPKIPNVALPRMGDGDEKRMSKYSIEINDFAALIGPKVPDMLRFDGVSRYRGTSEPLISITDQHGKVYKVDPHGTIANDSESTSSSMDNATAARRSTELIMMDKLDNDQHWFSKRDIRFYRKFTTDMKADGSPESLHLGRVVKYSPRKKFWTVTYDIVDTTGRAAEPDFDFEELNIQQMRDVVVHEIDHPLKLNQANLMNIPAAIAEVRVDVNGPAEPEVEDEFDEEQRLRAEYDASGEEQRLKAAYERKVPGATSPDQHDTDAEALQQDVRGGPVISYEYNGANTSTPEVQTLSNAVTNTQEMYAIMTIPTAIAEVRVNAKGQATTGSTTTIASANANANDGAIASADSTTDKSTTQKDDAIATASDPVAGYRGATSGVQAHFSKNSTASTSGVKTSSKATTGASHVQSFIDQIMTGCMSKYNETYNDSMHEDSTNRLSHHDLESLVLNKTGRKPKVTEFSVGSSIDAFVVGERTKILDSCMLTEQDEPNVIKHRTTPTLQQWPEQLLHEFEYSTDGLVPDQMYYDTELGDTFVDVVRNIGLDRTRWRSYYQFLGTGFGNCSSHKQQRSDKLGIWFKHPWCKQGKAMVKKSAMTVFKPGTRFPRPMGAMWTMMCKQNDIMSSDQDIEHQAWHETEVAVAQAYTAYQMSSKIDSFKMSQAFASMNMDNGAPGKDDPQHEAKWPSAIYGHKAMRAAGLIGTDGRIIPPDTWEEAKSRPDFARWKHACDKELEAFVRLHAIEYGNTLEEIRAKGITSGVIPWASFFVCKYCPKGFLVKYKNRRCMLGHSGNAFKHEHYTDTFAPTPLPATTRMLQAIALKQGLHRRSFDIRTAFLHAVTFEHELCPIEMPVGEKTYKTDSKGVKQETFGIMRRQIYGMPNSSKRFQQVRDRWILEHFSKDGWNVKRADSDPCLFIISRADDIVWMLCHSDDCDCTSKSESSMQLIFEAFDTKFGVEDCDPRFMLGIERNRSKDGKFLELTQTGFIEQLYEQFRHLIPGNKAPNIPVPYGTFITRVPQRAVTKERWEELEREGKRIHAMDFRSLLGSLLWCARMTRPECLVGCSMMAKVMCQPTQEAFDVGLSMLTYVYANRNTGIKFSAEGSLTPVAFYDSSNRADATTGKSNHGHVIMMADGPIVFESKIHRHVGMSASHCEYMSMRWCTQNISWIRKLFIDMDMGEHVTEPTVMAGDNDTATQLSYDLMVSTGNRFYMQEYHHVKEAVRRGIIRPCRIDTSLNLADPMTKVVSKQTLEALGPIMRGYSGNGVPIPEPPPAACDMWPDRPTYQKHEQTPESVLWPAAQAQALEAKCMMRAVKHGIATYDTAPCA